MIIIRSLFYQIAIPSNEEYAIYTSDYYLDRYGNVLTETDRTDVYEYGDVIIQTSLVKYTIKKVYSAYDYAVRMMDYIKEHIGDSVIYINMEELNSAWENHSGTFEVELLN